MKSIVLCSESLTNQSSLTFYGTDIHIGEIETPIPTFLKNDPQFENKVLVEKLAFSCNFRDRSNVLNLSPKIKKRFEEDNFKSGFAYFGSEFSGRIIDRGDKVTKLQIGDHVIINGAYPFRDSITAPAGLPTNKASARFEVLFEDQLFVVSKTMPPEVAASISIGAQTTYSMLRRLDLEDRKNVLIMSAKSNTSLFAASALKMRNCNIYTMSSSSDHAERFSKESKEHCIINFNTSDSRDILIDFFKRNGPIDYVIDPFADLHFNILIDLMNYNSKYIFCGVHSQNVAMDKLGKSIGMNSVTFAKMIIKNISLLGNCLGTTMDLENAINDYENGLLNVTIDSVFTDNAIRDFFIRSFIDRGRVGKVVFKY